MGRGKGLNEAEKAIIIKESAKGTSPDDIATKMGYRVDSVKRFRKDQEQRSDAGNSKTVIKKAGFEKYWSSGTDKTWYDKQVNFYRR